MRCFFIILALVSLWITTIPDALQAQAVAVVQGKIADAHTGQPLDDVHVFLSGTKIGTVTNSSGRYWLRNIPPGGHRLVLSIIGYGQTPVDLVIGPGEIKKVDVQLEPVVYEMEEIYVGNLDQKWDSHLERFSRLFIGETENADSVKILNPEVLRFDTNFWGRFTAEALAPLQIENRALGYHITYYLEEFHHSGLRTRWDGEPLYREMTPKDSSQAAYWRQNRREAFYGSLRHLFLTLLQDRLKEEGFVLYKHSNSVYGFSAENRHRVSARSLIRDGEESHLYECNFFGRLEIIYLRAEENPRYVEWARNLNRGPAGSQTSYLELNEHPITVDMNGEVLEPYGATQFGYYAFHRLADETPREYRPEEYPILSAKTSAER